MDLRAALNLSYEYDEPGVHQHATQLASSGETFGISPLPYDFMQTYGIKAAQSSNQATSFSLPLEHPSHIVSGSEESVPVQLNKSTPLSPEEAATLIIIRGSTLQTTGAQYMFLASRQNTAYAIVPIHTRDERVMFASIITDKFPLHLTKPINFDEFTRIWSEGVNGITIFYKTPEHLRGYYNGPWSEFSNIRNSVKDNINALKNLRSTLNSTARKRSAPKAQTPNPPKAPRIEARIISSPRVAAPTQSMPLAPKIPQLPLLVEQLYPQQAYIEHIHSMYLG